MTETFLIQHRSGGKYFKPEGDKTKDETRIVLHKYEEKYEKNMLWTFEKVRDHWGFIKHNASGKIIHPQGGELDSGDNIPLVLHKDRHDGALFALDIYNHRIVHLNGCFAQPENLKPNPPDEKKVILHSKVSNANNFLFISPKNRTQEVHVYGQPCLKGKWEILSMVRNAGADHIEKHEIKIGKSGTKNDTANEVKKKADEFLLQLEIETILKVAAKGSPSTETLSNITSSDTWSNGTTRTREIRVPPGKTVVTWQYVFTFEHSATASKFKSNLLADTESDSVLPEDLDDIILKGGSQKKNDMKKKMEDELDEL